MSFRYRSDKIRNHSKWRFFYSINCARVSDCSGILFCH